MKLNSDLLHSHIVKKLNKLKISRRLGSERIGISRATIHRISKDKPILLETYLTLIDWLEMDFTDYIMKPKRPNYIEKRLVKISEKQS